MLSCISRKIKIIKDFLSFEMISWNQINLIIGQGNLLIDVKPNYWIADIMNLSLCHNKMWWWEGGELERQWPFLQWRKYMEKVEWKYGPWIWISASQRCSLYPSWIENCMPTLTVDSPISKPLFVSFLLLHLPHTLGLDLCFSALPDRIIPWRHLPWCLHVQ